MSDFENAKNKAGQPALVPAALIYPFVLVTTLFALWGFANDITNPLVKAFKDVFVISNAQSSFVQTAFYGGYATMALPAALFIRRFTYKAGIILGLALYAIGAMISIPAAANVNFNLFLVSLYVLTFGLAFLETTANPFILSMGPKETATRRLNMAQAFNPIGSLTGMVVASVFILTNLNVSDFREDVSVYRQGVETDTVAEVKGVDPTLAAYLAEQPDLATRGYDDVLDTALADFKAGSIESFEGMTHREMQEADLSIVKTPYVVIGLIVLTVLVIFIFSKMPDTHPKESERIALIPTFGMLFKNGRYLCGVIAQTAYVAAQIMCWTFIIHYATTNIGMSAASAQNYNILAMSIFCLSRFICTFLLKFVSPGKLLMMLAVGGIVFTLGVIFLSGMMGLYSLIAVSACMSLMFPTIYGIALDGMGDEAKIASAGLIFAIVGGALMPPLQGRIIDLGGESGMLMGLPAVSVSFVLPLACFIIIAIYGFLTVKIFHEHGEEAVTHA